LNELSVWVASTVVQRFLFNGGRFEIPEWRSRIHREGGGNIGFSIANVISFPKMYWVANLTKF